MIFTTEYIEKVTEELLRILPGSEVAHVGSSYIAGDGADLDLVMLVPSAGFTERLILLAAGFTQTTVSEYSEDDGFTTFRRGDVNLILTDCPYFYKTFQVAAEVCRFLHLQYGITGKAVRIAVHRIIMNGASAEEAKESLCNSTQL